MSYRVPPYSAETQAPRQIGPRPLHLGGTPQHRCGGPVLAKRLQSRRRSRPREFDPPPGPLQMNPFNERPEAMRVPGVLAPCFVPELPLSVDGDEIIRCVFA